MTPHRDLTAISYIEGFIDYLLSLAFGAFLGIGDIIQLAVTILLGTLVIGMVIAISVGIIIYIQNVIKEFYDRNDDCENGISEDICQGLIENNEHQIIQEDKESYDEDARKIFGEETDMSSVGLSEKGYVEECCCVVKDDGQHTVKEAKESFDEDARTICGEGYDESAVDLDDKGYLEGR